ncbi:MAG: TAXI family TRAP transporter solute-binding subunit [Selenomonadaceae bacterium]|nr:TAXI family TRAP transporter solute-binding subunit [Selenomonadaceae bacterium]
MILCLTLTLTTLFATGCGEDNGGANGGAKDNKFINIATGGTAGTYYPIGGAMAEILNNSIEGMNASAQSTGASVANINMLQEMSVDLAIVQNDIAYYATQGTEMFRSKKIDNLRAIAALYPETCQIITLEKNGIQSVSDFKGKRIAVGAAGSGVEANARQIMAVYGITYDDIDVQYLSFGEASNALKDGNVDAAFVTAGYPTAAIQDIASQSKIVVIPVDEDKADTLTKDFPFYTKTVIPAGTYSGVDVDTPTVSVMAMLITTDKMSNELGGAITKALFENLDRLKAAHSAAAAINKEGAMKGIPIEMNGGAKAFFEK